MSQEKLLHLQGLRGVAIIFVVLFHFFPTQFVNGYIGVDIFFLLSGYLMAMMMTRYDQLGAAEIFDFLYRRVKRIVPLYYLVLLAILYYLYFSKSTLLVYNTAPALNALLFITNQIQPDGVTGYFEKLGTSVDLFTHTWSLSLEMQFYLLFPVIFIGYRSLPHQFKILFLLGTSLISFSYHQMANEFNSFNSVFARIWQFNAGTFTYLYSSISTESGEKEKESLLNKSAQKDYSPEITLVACSCLVLLNFLLCTSNTIDPNYSRVSAIFLTILVLQFGQGNSILENKWLVFVGEISYGWYLLHWPIAAHCRWLQLTGLLVLSIGLIASFLISVLVHFLIEKNFLTQGKIAIFALVSGLLLANAEVLWRISSSLPPTKELHAVNRSSNLTFTENPFNWPSDFTRDIIYGYENLTVEERIQLNDQYSAEDMKRTSMVPFCKQFLPTKYNTTTCEYRCDFNEGANNNSKETLLVVGNSWAANAMPVLAEECKSRFNHLEISFVWVCEVLAPFWNVGSIDCQEGRVFLEAVERLKPDVLFIMNRSFKMNLIRNGTTPFDDFVFKTASQRLTEIQKHVKRRIYILDAFPHVDPHLTEWLNNHLKTNSSIDYEKHADISQELVIGRMRNARLVAQCPKCRLFDYAPQFYFNGRLQMWDPKYFVSFMSSSVHLTPAGLERVRPLFKHLCSAE